MSTSRSKYGDEPLGDSVDRDYSSKLALFSSFAEPELRELIAVLEIAPGARILDAGCGVGAAARMLAERAGRAGFVTGLDLSAPHLAAARARGEGAWLQASLSAPPLSENAFDWVWCMNAIHHVEDPVNALRSLGATLRPEGQLVLCQSALLPDMVFAWDSETEWAAHAACRRYYRQEYGLEGAPALAWRRGVGWLREAGFERVRPRTLVIERTAPLDEAARSYLEQAVFGGYWQSRIDAFLTVPQAQRLRQWLNPDSPEYALKRPDFHFIQTLTCFIARKVEG